MQQEKCYRFQSTLPLWGATGSLNCAVVGTPISIHAPLAGSDLALRHMAPAYLISIHAPLAGSDGRLLPMLPFPPISIHAPLAGSDLPPGRHTSCPGNFNPRSPCGERRPARNRTWTTSYFNPRSPCGERHYWVTHYVNGLPISIHAPLAGSDHARPVDAPFQPVFQSTLPLRGATVVAAELGTCYQFQSTLPLRGATSPFQLVVLLP